MPVVVYNYLDKPQTVELKLVGGKWFKLLGEPAQKVELAAGEVRSVGFRIRAEKVGRFELEVSARGSGVSDAVKRPIEVSPDGRPVEQVFNGTLRQPAEITSAAPRQAIEGSVRAIVKIYPSSFSQVVEGLDAIFQRPYGCFEQNVLDHLSKRACARLLAAKQQEPARGRGQGAGVHPPRLSAATEFRGGRGRFRLVRQSPGEPDLDGLRPDGVSGHGPGPRRRSAVDRADAAVAARPAASRRLMGFRTPHAARRAGPRHGPAGPARRYGLHRLGGLRRRQRTGRGKGNASIPPLVSTGGDRRRLRPGARGQRPVGDGCGEGGRRALHRPAGELETYLGRRKTRLVGFAHRPDHVLRVRPQRQRRNHVAGRPGNAAAPAAIRPPPAVRWRGSWTSATAAAHGTPRRRQCWP